MSRVSCRVSEALSQMYQNIRAPGVEFRPVSLMETKPDATVFSGPVAFPEL